MTFKKFQKISKTLLLSQKRLEKERSGLKFRDRAKWMKFFCVTHIVSDHNSKFSKISKKIHLSQKRLEKYRNGRKFWMTVTQSVITIHNFQNYKKKLKMFKNLKIFKKVKIPKFSENLKTLKFTLISETIRDRAKWTKILDHTHC